MIVGTAGHIDHGKTTLVRALTGTDADRLPEEKRRGLTIDLGYAFMDTPAGERIAFVDVPGHERLVHTMVAGASGMDLALLLVAADDGPMPQTREHLAVLSLLGITQGAVVITKTDRADAGRVAAVREQMAGLIAGTPLASAPILAVSAQQGDGIGQLRALLLAAADRLAEHAGDRAAAPAFRLAIDRAFSLRGVGTVVTGTVHAGRVAVNDELALVPAARSAAARLRVRSVHAQDQAVASAHAGQRCAVALAGIELAQVQRGQWLVAPAVALQSGRLDTRLTLWQGADRTLRSGAHVQAHLGTARVAAAVALLDRETLEPGQTALAQLVLQADVGAWWGERLLLRDTAANQTLAGAVVLDPLAPTRYRRGKQRLLALQAMGHAAATERLQALLAVAPWGVDIRQFTAAAGLHELPQEGDNADNSLAGGHFALGVRQAEELGRQTRATLQAFHQQHPDELGPDRARLRRLVAPRLPAPLWDSLLDRLARTGELHAHGPIVHLPSHAVTLSATETRIAEKIAPALREAAFQGAWVRDLARDTGDSETIMRTTLARLARRGELYQVVKDLYFLPETMHRLAAIARQIDAAGNNGIQAGPFRDATGLGRKRAIQILEYFDRMRLTQRVGDTHRLRTDSDLFAEKKPLSVERP
ncbi:MAG: selenocysteine-specific translation elongation factor [Ottowia sp.]|nr:selenocysteine-specific translation elongation factor [Ottowia sp.]